MNGVLQGCGLSGLGLLSLLVLFPSQALAQTVGMSGSYVGVMVDAANPGEGVADLMKTDDYLEWIIENGLDGESSPTDSGDRQFQGRFDIPDVPVSVRGTVVMGDELRAVFPSLSYDLAIGQGANAYAGAGYAIVTQPGQITPLGDRNGFVITTGVEAAVGEELILYGDMRYRPGTNSTPENPSVRVQIGVGRRF